MRCLLALLLAGTAHAAAPLFDDLGSYHRPITTRSARAQRYFDQGLTLLFGFNHDEAIRSFTEATRLDPDCAMCFWGLADAHGPHINNPTLDPAHAQAAWEAIAQARKLEPKATPVEKDFIEALATRYAADPRAARAPLDQAYANAMREVWKRHPDDPEAGTLFAESMLDLRPWGQWTRDGKPEPGTEELVAALEAVLAKWPDEPGANHFYIHALEASPHPEKALAEAKRLETLVPGAAHLVHMPAHIYLRVGRYADAAEANRRAIAADKKYRAKAGRQGFYAMYIAHNYQFLWAADLWAGRRAEAAGAEAGMFESMHPHPDEMMTYPFYRMIRFGLWPELLRRPEPSADQPLTHAIWRFARGMALASIGKLADVAKELAALEQAVPTLSDQAGATSNSKRAVGSVALGILEGELAARRGKTDEAVKDLEKAAEQEDALAYNEPSDWVLPARQFLGRILLAAGQPHDAELAFRKDLEKNPENGWSLRGLADALEAQKSSEAAAVEQRFKKAWAVADVRIE